MNQKIFISQINTKSDLPVFKHSDINKSFLKYLVAAECIKRKPKTKEKANAILLEVKEKFLKYTVKDKYVENRKLSLLPKDWFNNLPKEGIVFPDLFANFYENVNGVSIKEKMKFYEQYLLDYLRKYITEPSDEIINVSCTGVQSPNPVQKFVSEKGWKTGISTCLFNDCYASIIAVKNACGLLYNPALSNVESVNIIHSELLSIHSDANDISAQNLVVMSLFGDGLVNYRLTKQAVETGIEVKFIKEKIIPESGDHMQWHLGERIFQMSLSVMVPYLLNDNIYPFIVELAEDYKIDLQDLIENSIWAIHPGGPKIVEMVSDKLNLKAEQTKYSYEVLKENGNMTSATIPFIWDKIVNDKTIPKGKRIVSMAFGPGLTACAMIGEKV